ncbi:hypothetical protein BJ085DRAFT_28328 [Dimargaris cristalligena]|uniref:SCD domain-containing protein n=1 Tax=Dimargaris cristalligena TaxID=215637 RepID=A0A4P9ZR55_9FUNG|nr:hypothetical protein BJ085DRAFT_28328 [Dimargaris cristalligena]|eukprot:RKP35221.1 hypothetical protein BJ085DRAFT_28328 [Dimargaris cristalligena]
MVATPQRRSTRTRPVAATPSTTANGHAATDKTAAAELSSSSLTDPELESDSDAAPPRETPRSTRGSRRGRGRPPTKGRGGTPRITSTRTDPGLDNGDSSEDEPPARGRPRGRGAKRARHSSAAVTKSLWDIDSVSQVPAQPSTRGTAKRRRGGASNRVSTRGEPPATLLDDAESVLFEAIMDKETALASVVSDWIDSYSSDASAALLDLINLMIRACGCQLGIGGSNLHEEDVAVTVLTDLQTRLKSDTPVDFPMQSKSKIYKRFAKNCLDFFGRLLQQGQHVLVYRGEFMDTFGLWLTLMTGSSFRPFRYTATLIALTSISTLCELSQGVQANLTTTHRQLKTEQQKRRRSGAGTNQGRLQQLEQTVANLNSQASTLAQLTDKWFAAVFTHRYRDMDPHIRQECVKALANWISKLPSRFLEDKYLRFIGWMLSDKVAAVRQEAVGALIHLFNQPALLPGLYHFIKRFEGRLVTMALYDADVTGTRLGALELVALLCQQGLVEGGVADVFTHMDRVESTANEAGAPAHPEDVSNTDGADTINDIAKRVLAHYRITQTQTSGQDSTYCVCQARSGDPHTFDCTDQQVVRRILQENPLQVFFIPLLFNSRPRVRQAVAPLVAWWVTSYWLPAFANAELGSEDDPLGLEVALSSESESEISADDDSADEASEPEETVDSTQRTAEGTLTWRALGTLSKRQERKFRLYKTLTLLLEAFTRPDAPSPDESPLAGAIHYDDIQVEELTGRAQTAFNLRVCAATAALTSEVPELVDWKALCTYATLDHSYSSHTEPPPTTVPVPETVAPSFAGGRSARRRKPTRPTPAPAPVQSAPTASYQRCFWLTEAQESVFLDFFVECLKAVCGMEGTATNSTQATILAAGSATGAGVAASGGVHTSTKGNARERKRQAEYLQEQESNLNQLSQRLIDVIPSLLARYRADANRISKILCLVTDGILRLDVFLEVRKVTGLRELATETKMLYFNHGSPLVLDQTLAAFRLILNNTLLGEGEGGDTDGQSLRHANESGDEPSTATAPLLAKAAMADMVKSMLDQVYDLCLQIHRLDVSQPLAVTIAQHPDGTLVAHLTTALYRLHQLAKLGNLELLNFQPSPRSLGEGQTDASMDEELPTEITDLLPTVGSFLATLLQLITWDERIPSTLDHLNLATISALALQILNQQFVWLVGHVQSQYQPAVNDDGPSDALGDPTTVAGLAVLQKYIFQQSRAWLEGGGSDTAGEGVLGYRLIQHDIFQTHCQLLWLLSGDITHPQVCPPLVPLRVGVDATTREEFGGFIQSTLAHWLDVVDSPVGEEENEEGEEGGERPRHELDRRLLLQARQSVASYLQGFTLDIFTADDAVPLLTHYGLLDPVYDDMVKLTCEQLAQAAPPVDRVTLNEHYEILKQRQHLIGLFATAGTSSFDLWLNRCRHRANPTVSLARMLAQSLRTMKVSHPNLPPVIGASDPLATPRQNPHRVDQADDANHGSTTLNPTPQQQLYQLNRVITSAVTKLHQEGISYALTKYKGYQRLENSTAAVHTLKFFKALVPFITGLITPFQAESIKLSAADIATTNEIEIPNTEGQLQNTDPTTAGDGETMAGPDRSVKDWDAYHHYLKQLQKRQHVGGGDGNSDDILKPVPLVDPVMEEDQEAEPDNLMDEDDPVSETSQDEEPEIPESIEE